ncbi:MAG: hypothetical protein HQL95_00925 [Magnetococcales bacterium]|nr:hypothetical protein [Magnetococcales bacterium]
MPQNNPLIRTPARKLKIALLIALPINREEYQSDRDNCQTEPRRYVNSSACFDHYAEKFIQPVTDLIGSINDTSIEVNHHVSLSDFSQYFSGNHNIIILVTHCEDGWMEFRDRFYREEEIAEIIPDTFTGILDLSVCQPIKLAKLLDATNDNMIAHVIFSRATPAFWMQYFRILFWRIINSDDSYLEASIFSHQNLDKLSQ